MKDEFDSLPYVPGSDTSKAAADAGVSKATEDARKIYNVIHVAGPLGATCDEVEHVLNMLHQTASARIADLKRARWVEDSGCRRQTTRGSLAAVYVSVPEDLHLYLGSQLKQVFHFAVITGPGLTDAIGPYADAGLRDAAAGSIPLADGYVLLKFSVDKRTGAITLQKDAS